MADQTTIGVDLETKAAIAAIAAREARTQIEVMRRMVNGFYLGDLSPFDQAVLHQVAKDEGLDSLLDATSYVIRDWQRLKAALELRRPALSVDSPPHAPAIRVPASEAQPVES